VEEYSRYPWYTIISDDTLEQGDVFVDCPVFVPRADLSPELLEGGRGESAVNFDCASEDVIVLTQTCDLVKGREKVTEVLLCPLNEKTDFAEGALLAKKEDWERARKGGFPGYHVINRCSLSGHEFEPMVVSFRRVYSLPLDFLRQLATIKSERIRLLPPYREHLSQAFARYFMRVGLPVDIPAFK